MGLSWEAGGGHIPSGSSQDAGAAVTSQTWGVSPELCYFGDPTFLQNGVRALAAVPGSHGTHQVLVGVLISGEQQATSWSPLDG